MRGSKLQCTMIPRNGIRKDATPVYTKRYGAIVSARVKEKAGTCMYVVCRGYATHEEERRKGNFCVCDRFSADGFRTRAARMIRRRTLWVRATKGKTGEERRGRPGNSWALGKRCVCVGVRSVSAGRGPEGSFTLGQAWFLSTVSWFLGSDSGLSYSRFIEETKGSKSGEF